jgi:hypothetical protein
LLSADQCRGGAPRRAFTDTGRSVPDEMKYRTVGAQDVEPAADD